MSVNESTKKETIFFDGKEVASQTYTKALRSYGNGPNYRIGGITNYAAYGIIDDAMIFGAPLK
jgi:hypothetical protein